MSVDWSSAFAQALPYSTFLETYGSVDQRERWGARRRGIELRPDQIARLNAFTRRMPVICLAGAWCGDCARQVPIFDAFAAASPKIELRLLDRDAQPTIRDQMKINGGHRVPAAMFLSEDFHPVLLYGDTTLSGYRRKAGDAVGKPNVCSIVKPADALPKPTDQDFFDALTDEWLDEFERVQLVLRLSPRLREKHGD